MLPAIIFYHCCITIITEAMNIVAKRENALNDSMEGSTENNPEDIATGESSISHEQISSTPAAHVEKGVSKRAKTSAKMETDDGGECDSIGSDIEISAKEAIAMEEGDKKSFDNMEALLWLREHQCMHEGIQHCIVTALFEEMSIVKLISTVRALTPKKM